MFFLLVLCGCVHNQHEYADYEHYDLANYNHKKFEYVRDTSGHWYDIKTEKYAIAVISEGGFREGLLYELDEKDYILLDSFDGAPDEFDKENSTLLYKDKIYIRRWTALYEYILDRENTKKRNLEFDYTSIINNYKEYKELNCSDFVYGISIDKVDDDYIYLSNVRFHCVENLILNLKCSLSSYKCEEYKE